MERSGPDPATRPCAVKQKAESGAEGKRKRAPCFTEKQTGEQAKRMGQSGAGSISELSGNKNFAGAEAGRAVTRDIDCKRSDRYPVHRPSGSSGRSSSILEYSTGGYFCDSAFESESG